ncbi:sulfatase-like hydrolase/transferase [Kriegella aquimaris]|uniref:Arylsulfatase A n=1 Tax=Kriegella aquimaris TaxID=192904 RepID=A0A1G9RGH7_9FLAO|nr:sulfatase-like hydrolase/transferase [Kriegella aquimaris]SDM21967.1 Arylsulfatase A [Kriegella aquimaris]
MKFSIKYTNHIIGTSLVPILLFLAVLHTPIAIAQVKKVQTKPNIILIMADDLGQETLGVYGSDSYATPNLDRLANEGMRFDQCYATPLCTPSRVQLMTGKYNHKNYIGFGLLDPKEKTFGHFMQATGYKTFIAGKWQLLGNAHQQKLAGGKIGSTPEQAGFDAHCLWQIDQIGSRYKDPLLSTYQKGTVKFPNQYGPDVFVKHIEAFMEENKDVPMFIYYPMVLTHDPFVPVPDNPEFKSFDAKSKVNDPIYFGEMVNYMDKLVGDIVQKTEDLGIRENTLILFIGDNGTDRDVTSIVNGKPLRGDKGHTTNAGTQVPFIANWKGKIKPGEINNHLIDFTDFLPTLLQASRQPSLPKSETDGISFYGQLFGENENTREWIFCHYAPNWGKFESRRYVQNKDWKLYGNGEFYNLAKDSLEKNPLNTKEQSIEIQATVTKFQSVLNQFAK